MAELGLKLTITTSDRAIYDNWSGMISLLSPKTQGYRNECWTQLSSTSRVLFVDNMMPVKLFTNQHHRITTLYTYANTSRMRQNTPTSHASIQRLMLFQCWQRTLPIQHQTVTDMAS